MTRKFKLDVERICHDSCAVLSLLSHIVSRDAGNSGLCRGIAFVLQLLDASADLVCTVILLLAHGTDLLNQVSSLLNIRRDVVQVLPDLFCNSYTQRGHVIDLTSGKLTEFGKVSEPAATVAKPFPCSPGRAALVAAVNASK